MLDHLAQHAHQTGAVLDGEQVQQAAQRGRVVGAQTEHACSFHRELRGGSAELPVKTAHARQILGAREFALAAFQFAARARRAQQVAQAAGEQVPLVGLDEEIGCTGFVGATDRRVVVQAGEHQDGQRLEPGAATQHAAGLESVQARHHGVEHQHVGYFAGDVPQRSFARRHLRHRESAVAKRRRDNQQDDLIVVDEQHLGRRRQLVVGRRGG